MKKIFVSQNIHDVNLLKGFLEAQGIACLVKNEYLNNLGAFGLPVPEIWILNDKDLDKALSIVKDWLRKNETI